MKRVFSDCGSATVTSVALSLLLIAGTAGSLIGIQTVVAARRTQVAADLGALAGAGVLESGDPCVTAAAVIVANGAQLATCVVTTDAIRIKTSLPNPISRWIPLPRIVSEARAGN